MIVGILLCYYSKTWDMVVSRFIYFIDIIFLRFFLRYNPHTIKLTHFKCAVLWLLIYSELCSHHNFRSFSSPQNETLYLLIMIPQFSHPPQPRQPLIYFLSLWIYQFLTFHIHRIVLYVFFMANSFYFT